MRRLILFVIPAALLLVGCAPQARVYQLTSPYSEADFLPWKNKGTATLVGQAFMKTVGGDVKTCAGNDVFVLPANKYNHEVMGEIMKPGTVKFTNRDSGSFAYNIKTTCDSQGNFAFPNIAADSWYIIVDVTWGVPTQYGVDSQGGMLVKLVDLKAGANSVVLTGKDWVR